MGRDRPYADVEHRGDDLVWIAFGDHAGDFALARTETRRGRALGAREHATYAIDFTIDQHFSGFVLARRRDTRRRRLRRRCGMPRVRDELSHERFERRGIVLLFRL